MTRRIDALGIDAPYASPDTASASSVRMDARRALGLDSPSGTLKEPEGPGSQATASFLIAV